MKSSSLLLSVALLALIATAFAQCATTCEGNTPICSGTNCVACNVDSQCWAISDNELVCNASSGACGNCSVSTSCPEDAPICSKVTRTCTTCNATAECASRLSGSVCLSNSGLCGWCSSDAECAPGYGTGSKCQNVTEGVRKCTIPTQAGPPLPDPNNINGIITAYVIICIVLLVLFIMFIACACIKDEDYSPSNAPQTKADDRKADHGKANGHANGTSGNSKSNGHGKEVELEEKPGKAAKSKK